MTGILTLPKELVLAICFRRTNRQMQQVSADDPATNDLNEHYLRELRFQRCKPVLSAVDFFLLEYLPPLSLYSRTTHAFATTLGNTAKRFFAIYFTLL